MQLANSSASSDPSLAALLLAAGAPASTGPVSPGAPVADASAPGFEQLFSDVAGEPAEETDAPVATDLWGSSTAPATVAAVVSAPVVLTTAEVAVAAGAFGHVASDMPTETPVEGDAEETGSSDSSTFATPRAGESPRRCAAADPALAGETPADSRFSYPATATARVSAPVAADDSATSVAEMPATTPTPATPATTSAPVPPNVEASREPGGLPVPTEIASPSAPYEPWPEAGATVPVAQAMLYRRGYQLADSTNVDLPSDSPEMQAPATPAVSSESEEPVAPAILFSSQHAAMRQAAAASAPSSSRDVQPAFTKVAGPAVDDAPAQPVMAAEAATITAGETDSSRPGGTERPGERAPGRKAAMAGEAIFADPAGAKRTAEPGREKAFFKRFVSADEQQVATQDQVVGIGVAKSSPHMPTHPASTFAHPSSEYTGVLGVAETNLGTVTETARAEPLPELGSAREAVEVVLHAVAQVAQRGQKSVNLQFSVGDADLKVRVELQGGEVRTTFRTDSDELRAALSQEWQVVSAQVGERSTRIAAPVFTTNSPSATDSAAGDASSRQRENHGHPQRDGTGQPQTSPNFAARTNSAPAVAVRTEARPVYANSRHLQTLA